jgi:predicted transcriptional regulator of viral defense system
MKHQTIDYRISLLHAAAFHGSSHQAAMVFQVIVPKQLRSFDIGRHRLQFIYQGPAAFAKVNVPKLLGQLKSEAGFAKVAGVELTLLDCARYFHKSGGINGIAQIVKDLGTNADPQKLAEAGAHYENSAVRRLGYLLDLEGHARQSSALKPFVARAKSMKPLDPSVRSLSESLDSLHEKNFEWKLLINTRVEIDS